LMPVNHGVDRPGWPRPQIPRGQIDAALAGGSISDSYNKPTTSWVAPNGLPRGSLVRGARVPDGASDQRPNDLPARDGCKADPTVPRDCSSASSPPPVSMKLMPAFPRIWQPLSPAERDIKLQWGLVMNGSLRDNDRHDDATPQEHGRNLAHEMGHFFGLVHRAGNPSNRTDGDGVPWPQWENLMQWNGRYPDSQNLDILQCKAMRFSEIMYRPNAIG
jgi:hypothetical protein